MRTLWTIPLIINILSLGMWIAFLYTGEVELDFLAGLNIGLASYGVVLSLIYLIVPQRKLTN